MDILSIDPGTDTGYSLWQNGKVSRCGIGTPVLHVSVDIIVIEVPRIYPGGSKAPPNDIVTLGITVGRLLERSRMIVGGDCFGIFPRTWKGTIAKDIMIRRIKYQVGDRNREYVDTALYGTAPGMHHNVWDAVGIGYWAISEMMAGAKLGRSPMDTMRSVSDVVFSPL